MAGGVVGAVRGLDGGSGEEGFGNDKEREEAEEDPEGGGFHCPLGFDEAGVEGHRIVGPEEGSGGGYCEGVAEPEVECFFLGDVNGV